MPEPSVYLIRHHVNETELNDTVSNWLAGAGYAVRHLYPCNGDKLDCLAAAVPTVVLGGGQNVTQIDSLPWMQSEVDWIRHCIDHEVPLLGLCLGAQLIAHALGAAVGPSTDGRCEFGWFPVDPPVQAGASRERQILSRRTWFMQAHYQGFSLPDKAVSLARPGPMGEQAFRFGDNTFALQFHPEVTAEILENWLQDSWSDDMLASPGAQPADEQRVASRQYEPVQRRWFEEFLEDVFGRPEIPGRG